MIRRRIEMTVLWIEYERLETDQTSEFTFSDDGRLIPWLGGDLV